MSSLNTHASNIVNLADQADALVDQLLPILRQMSAEESGARKLNNGPFPQGGRSGVAHHAIARLQAFDRPDPPGGRQTSGSLARMGWRDHLEGV
ncbi:hypothetical protein AB4144_17885 [Rhizobiaceae sp. 2RAB30]